MIKALEVHTKDKDDDFIAINHFQKDGSLLKFESENTTENLIESRTILNESYDKLYYQDAFK
jgi:hypothetical protein